ncbi:NTP transferase domain-containing protein [Pontibacter sp. G13]|uniref:NTP transferase domain-containing protein n=1 Tax=Pontibacter sp. G13 TaxID=3074898 RepID=UPI00288A7525|nr:NTP transferase domain-containing protein [Pontibacter sp. G13]WNJ17994.1 NTP transferase domain-containing protein [Pontibacter sp. G13]
MVKHQKHAKLQRPNLGAFARNEWALLGAPCGVIQQLARDIAIQLNSDHAVTFIDERHLKDGPAPVPASEPFQARWTKHADAVELAERSMPNSYSAKFQLRSSDIVLVNGNHFLAQQQIVCVHPKKTLSHKLDRLTQVVGYWLAPDVTEIPAYLKEHVGNANLPIWRSGEEVELAAWLKDKMLADRPPVKGLVLAGGKSQRMKRDKSKLAYHGKPQHQYVAELLNATGVEDVFLSCRSDQAFEDAKIALLPDTFMGLGPFGGILSAFRSDPNAAWLVLACDLPFLDAQTLAFLLKHRNPSKVATAFYNPETDFPEPLITLWEPRAYPRMLEFLSIGNSCPRKVLINSEIELLKVPNLNALKNVNTPEDYDAAVAELKVQD